MRNAIELARLSELENVIDAGLKTFVDVGNALLEIRDSRLYREGWGTFEEYCQDRWGWQRNYANKMISAATVVNNLGTIVPISPATESQTRPLTSLPPEAQRQAWQTAVETAPNGKVTAAHVKSVVDEMTGRTVAPVIIPDPQWDDLEDEAEDRPYSVTVIDEWGSEETIRIEPDKEIVARGPKEILAAAKQIREEKEATNRAVRVERINTIARGNKPLDAKGRLFPVLLVDPPWRYEFSSDNADKIENHYPTMPLEEICSLPVASIASPDSILFLWATSPKLEESLQVISAWGYTYRTCLVWVKDRIGMGYYARQSHELLLVARRGEMVTPDRTNRFSSVIEAKPGKHSEKPEVVYEMIEKMYPEFDKVELFAREKREGWFSWGNQV